jgi:hypothetical protein
MTTPDSVNEGKRSNLCGLLFDAGCSRLEFYLDPIGFRGAEFDNFLAPVASRCEFRCAAELFSSSGAAYIADEGHATAEKSFGGSMIIERLRCHYRLQFEVNIKTFPNQDTG